MKEHVFRPLISSIVHGEPDYPSPPDELEQQMRGSAKEEALS